MNTCTQALQTPAFFQDNILTLERIVEVINDGGTVSSSAELLAGYYAYEAALEGCDDDISVCDEDAIEAHLDALKDAGAKFQYKEAATHAMNYLRNHQAV